MFEPQHNRLTYIVLLRIESVLSTSMESPMEAILKQISPFTVAGIGVRTINSDESDPTVAKIGPLWERFFVDDIMGKISDRDPDSPPLYGVYTDYETDRHGHYTMTVGVKVTGSASREDGITEVRIEGGEYLVFRKEGSIPDIVVETWEEIWDFFAKDDRYTRRYTTDFEEYYTDQEVSIHIAVNRGEV
jgi:predicted transcriptional regulator YdeE